VEECCEVGVHVCIREVVDVYERLDVLTGLLSKRLRKRRMSRLIITSNERRVELPEVGGVVEAQRTTRA